MGVYEPAAKRLRFDQPPQSPANFSITLSNVPSDFTHETLVELHSDMGLPAQELLSSHFMGKHPGNITCSCTLRYKSEAAAVTAADVLNEQALEALDGTAVLLEATLGVRPPSVVRAPLPRVVAPPPPQASQQLCRTMGKAQELQEVNWCAEMDRCLGKKGMMLYEDLGSGMPYCEACWSNWSGKPGSMRGHVEALPPPRPQAAASRHAPAVTRSRTPAAPATIAVRILEVPIDYTEDTVSELLEAAGIDTGNVAAMTFCDSREEECTCACIIDFAAGESAQQTMAALHGVPVLTQSGEEKLLAVKLMGASSTFTLTV